MIKQYFFLPLLKSNLSVRLSIKTCGLEVFVIIYFFSNFFWLIQRINSLCVSFNKLSELLPAFACARAIGDLWSICLGVNIFGFKNHWTIVFYKFDSIISSMKKNINIWQSFFCCLVLFPFCIIFRYLLKSSCELVLLLLLFYLF